MISGGKAWRSCNDTSFRENGMLKGKNAVITGSTSGLGLGIAEGVAKEGINLVLNGFGDAAEIEKLRSGLASRFGV